MLSSIERRQLPAVVSEKKEALTKYLSAFTAGAFSTLDEPYRLLSKRAYSLLRFGDLPHNYMLSESLPFDPEALNRFIDEMREISEADFSMIPEIYNELQKLADLVLSATEEVNGKLQPVLSLIKTVEGSLKQSATVTSIKNEYLAFDTMGASTFLREGSLTLDIRSGSLMLPVVAANTVPFTVFEVTCNKPKGVVNPGTFGKPTIQCFSDGYFTSRTFARSPRIEKKHVSLMNPPELTDGLHETSALQEYNSFSPDDRIVTGLRLLTEGLRVDAVSVMFDPPDVDDAHVSESSLPSLSSLRVGNTYSTVDVKDMLVDNRIRIGDKRVGEVEDRVRWNGVDTYPTINYLIMAEAIENIDLYFESGYPQLIHYPELVLLGPAGHVVKRFNYLETLVLNGYEPPDDTFMSQQSDNSGGSRYLDPRERMTSEQIRYMQDLVDNAYEKREELKPLYRHYIGIKEVELYQYSYAQRGSSVTANLNTTGKVLASVELFVNEIVPSGTSISYACSHDGSDWYEIYPQDRPEGYPKRLVFAGFEPTSIDGVIDVSATSLFLRITMTSDNTFSPVLKSYAVRLKYL